MTRQNHETTVSKALDRAVLTAVTNTIVLEQDNQAAIRTACPTTNLAALVTAHATAGYSRTCSFVVVRSEALADQGRRTVCEGAECFEGEVENARAWS